MKTIIAGSRHLTSKRELQLAIRNSGLGALITEVVSGKAPGMDTTGEEWAAWKGLPVKPFPAAWRPGGILDRGAGHKRNEKMAVYADALIAVWDGKSAGTKDMIDRARKHGLTIHVHLVD